MVDCHFCFLVNVNKLKAFEDIKKAEIMQEKQRLEAMKREHRGDKMSEKMEVHDLCFNVLTVSREISTAV